MAHDDIKNVVVAAVAGKTESTIKNYRDGSSQPPLDVALKIAEFLGIPVATLMVEVDNDGYPIEQPVTA
jgi:transcriptional regulator with XRE-family HTH domain